MRFPYLEVGPGIHRPIFAARFWGLGQVFLADGLADTGSDRTLLTSQFARALGIDLDVLPATTRIQAATGESLTCRIATLPIQLVRGSEQICWLAEVGIPLEPIRINHWGFKGFLEYFRAEFDGPARSLSLTPGDSIPAINPPT